ncbi:class I SAM-dependent methyltransferase [Marivirga sp.]|uniref:class I SAM-dependent methyltransferase n=1 Tax=Marivirga sp. TaxID=2018662 RepID=UPI002D7E298F|nr:class I SAM-dependent methyltransferase [Marivirga sp.]HET8861158.1 class I SAM-dependent methyltransferase [Marivirga sp.]
MDWKQLNNELGNIDLYWLDFILKGYLPDKAKILDAGSGEGRNIIFCLKNNMNVFGFDQNSEAIDFLRLYAKQSKIDNIEARFQVMKMEKILFPDNTFDVVICSAVLHFARNAEHFNSMIYELLRVLAPSGKIFIRTMTDQYLPQDQLLIDENLYLLPNEQIRYIINAEVFVQNMKERNMELIEPFKEVVVQNRHSMGTFMLQKLK